MSFKLEITNSNPAFQKKKTVQLDPSNKEICRLLRNLAETLMNTAEKSGKLTDINGHVVGTWELTDDNADTTLVRLPDRIYTETGLFRVTDPCYKPNTWCAGDVQAKPGWYTAYVQVFEDPTWGHRVSYMALVHETNDGEKGLDDINSQAPFEVGVDSGTCAIIDMEYFKQIHAEDGRWETWFDYIDSLTYRPGKPNATGVDDRAALISAAGYGDGAYTCWLRHNEKGEIDGILVEFITESEIYEALDEA